MGLNLNAPGSNQSVPQAGSGQQLVQGVPQHADAIEQGEDDQCSTGWGDRSWDGLWRRVGGPCWRGRPGSGR
eukprot:9517798-Alexandrium_andersonii.AAC.1